jgi:hypothetical protein
MGNNRLFTDVTEKNMQNKADFPQELDPDFGGPFTRTSRAHALRPKPEPGEARRASARVLPSSSHPHLQEYGEHPII